MEDAIRKHRKYKAFVTNTPRVPADFTGFVGMLSERIVAGNRRRRSCPGVACGWPMPRVPRPRVPRLLRGREPDDWTLRPGGRKHHLRDFLLGVTSCIVGGMSKIAGPRRRDNHLPSQPAASCAQYVRMMSAPARRIAVSDSNAAAFSSSQPLRAAALIMLNSPETL